MPGHMSRRTSQNPCAIGLLPCLTEEGVNEGTDPSTELVVCKPQSRRRQRQRGSIWHGINPFLDVQVDHEVVNGARLYNHNNLETKEP